MKHKDKRCLGWASVAVGYSEALRKRYTKSLDEVNDKNNGDLSLASGGVQAISGSSFPGNPRGSNVPHRRGFGLEWNDFKRNLLHRQ